MTSQALVGGLSVTGRILVAVLLGYALAYAVTACLSIYLPLPRPDRVSFGSLGCFAVWVAAIVYAFAAPHTAKQPRLPNETRSGRGSGR